MMQAEPPAPGGCPCEVLALLPRLHQMFCAFGWVGCLLLHLFEYREAGEAKFTVAARYAWPR